MRYRIFLITVLAWSLANGLFRACAAPTEPSTSWVYPYLYELRIRQAGLPMPVTTGPYDRSRIARWIGDFGAEPAEVDQRSLWLYRMLRHEFSDEIVPAKTTDLAAIGNVLVSSGVRTDRKPPSEVFMRAAFHSGPDLCMWTTMRTTLNGEDRHKTETGTWQDRARASFDQGGITYRKGAFSVFLGRDEVSWGAEREAGLLMSGSAPNMDMLKIAFESDRFFFTSFHSQLRQGKEEQWDRNVRRFAAGHRLEVLVGPSLSVSMSEAVVYGGENRSLEMAYVNPLTVFYAEQWNSVYQDNILIAGDFSWLMRGRAEIRGEIMVDDFQYDFSTEPHELAAGLSVAAVNPVYAEASMLGGSYFHVRNRTYGHYVEWNRWVHEGEVIGYPDGPDGDRLCLWTTLALPEAVRWKLDYALRRRGEGRATDTLERVGSKVAFPSGVVETLQKLGFEVSWRPHYEWMLNGRVEWHRFKNQDNVDGSDNDDFRLLFSVTYNLKWSSKL